MKKTKPVKPWQDEHGKSQSTENIVRISSHWSPATWGKYLKSLEGDSKESLLLEPTDIETFSEQECYPQIYAVNERTVKTYSPTNRKIICKVSKNITNVTAVSNVTEVTKVNYAKKITINRGV